MEIYIWRQSMTFKYLYTNGSSITQGYPLDKVDVRDAYKKYHNITYDNYRDINWPGRLGKALDLKVIDESRHGGSISRVVRMTSDYILNNSEEKNESTLFVLEFPSGYRDEIWSNKLNRYFNHTIGIIDGDSDLTEEYESTSKMKDDIRDYFKKFVDDKIHTKQDCRNFIFLISLLEYFNLKYFIINQSIREDVNRNYPKFKMKNIVNWNEGDCIVQWYWKENKLSIDNDFTEYVEYATDDYHPGYFGHLKIAEYLYEWISKRT